jgi:glycerol transport system ATP-binding protein
VAEIRLEGLRHRYPKAIDDALKSMDLTWEHGGAYALLGPSGCGKTTMLNVISGLVKPTSGRIFFDGVDVTALSTAQRNIAQVFQFPVLYDTMTVEQNLQFPLRNRGVDKGVAQRRAEEVAELLEISHLLKRRAKGLSADAKQLVSLSRALVRQDVTAILFDEPLTVIDPQQKWRLRQVLKRVQAELNHTLVYVTHDQTEALTFADTVVVMNDGEVMQKGTPDELFERPDHTFVGHFIGSPGMNFIPCTVHGGIAGFGGVDLLRLPSSISPEQQPGDVVGIRPDYVRCAPTEPGGLEAIVAGVRDLGTVHLVDLRVGDAVVLARIAAGQYVPRERCRIVLDAADVHFFRDGRRVHGITAALPTGVAP